MLFNGRYQSPRKSDGTINSAGKVTFYETGTSTLKTVYQDENLSTAHTNPVILDSNGSALIFLGTGSYDYKVEDSDDNTIVSTSGPITGSASADSFQIDPSMLVNGNFIDFNSGTNHPNDWTITEDSGGTIAVIDSDGYPDGKALQFTGTGSGGGTAQSSKIPINPYDRYILSFQVTTTADGTTNHVKINLYDDSDTLQHTYTAWTRENYALSNGLIRYTFRPASNSETTVTYARILITGVDSAGADAAGSSIFYAFNFNYDRRYPFPHSRADLLVRQTSNTEVKIIWQDADQDIFINVTGDITNDVQTGEGESASTWYQIYLISDGETVAVRFVTDGTGVSLSSANDVYYSEFVGYVYNDASSNLHDFYQQGDTCILRDEIEMLAIQDVDTTWVDANAINLPPDIFSVLCNFVSYGNVATALAYLDARGSGLGSGHRVGGSNDEAISACQAWIATPTTTTTSIQVKHTNSNAQQARVALAGFKVNWQRGISD